MITQNEKNERTSTIRWAILSTVAATGIIAVGVCLPNFLVTLDFLEKNLKKMRKGSSQEAFTRSLKLLVKQGLVEYTGKQRSGLRLTLEGKKLLYRIQLKNLRYKKPAKWDGKWRVVVFDIREKQRYKRDGLRSMLQQVGFFQLQQSVWVFPYHCEELVALLKVGEELGKSVVYMVVERIEGDSSLKDYFDL